MHIKATPERRNVVLDIETRSLNSDDQKGALSALTGRILCIGLLIDDGRSINEITLIDEQENAVLTEFWAVIEPGDVFIGHNILDFDLPFIRQRSWIHSIRPSRRIDLRRFYSVDVIDTMQLWSSWGTTKYPALDRLGEALGCGRKSGSGLQVADWWALGNKLAVAEYCQDDVRLTFNIFNRMMFQPIPDRYLLRDKTVHVLNKQPVLN